MGEIWPILNRDTIVSIKQMKEIGRMEGNVLFNDTLSTFYLRLYGVRHMVTDHSDSERENLLLPHGLLFLISFCYTIVEHWLEREIAQWVHHERSTQ